jgi:hypothetical protein
VRSLITFTFISNSKKRKTESIDDDMAERKRVEQELRQKALDSIRRMKEKQAQEAPSETVKSEPEEKTTDV